VVQHVGIDTAHHLLSLAGMLCERGEARKRASWD
jgi:hypothetical protein